MLNPVVFPLSFPGSSSLLDKTQLIRPKSKVSSRGAGKPHQVSMARGCLLSPVSPAWNRSLLSLRRSQEQRQLGAHPHRTDPSESLLTVGSGQWASPSRAWGFMPPTLPTCRPRNRAFQCKSKDAKMVKDVSILSYLFVKGTGLPG